MKICCRTGGTKRQHGRNQFLGSAVSAGKTWWNQVSERTEPNIGFRHFRGGSESRQSTFFEGETFSDFPNIS